MLRKEDSSNRTEALVRSMVEGKRMFKNEPNESKETFHGISH